MKAGDPPVPVQGPGPGLPPHADDLLRAAPVISRRGAVSPSAAAMRSRLYW